MTSAMQGILVDVARVAAWLFLLTVIFVPLERLFAERSQPVARRQFGVDLGYFLGNGIVTAALLSGITTPSLFPPSPQKISLVAAVLATIALGALALQHTLA